MEQPKLIYQKNAERTLNKVVLPKKFVEQHGREYFMEIYNDYIKLVPIKKEGK